MTTQPFNALTKDEWEKIRNDKKLRQTISGKSFYWFFHLYFGHYVEYETAPFQKEMFTNLEDESIQHLVILAFRGSGKSTIATTALPLWSIIGERQLKFIVIVSQTQQQAQAHLKSLRLEVEQNEILRNDFGSLEEESNEWGVASLVFPKFGAKVMAVSKDQAIRGMRHGKYRPQLIISDDVEDVASTKQQDQRNSTEKWFTSEVLTLGNKDTRFITIGNLLHEDSLIMRLIDKMNRGEMYGKYLRYPILRAKTPLWQSQFPNYEAVMDYKKRIGNRVTWEREYMLNIVPDEDQLVTYNMIHYYDSLPSRGCEFALGVDVALSEKESADYTALVTVAVKFVDEKPYIYVLPRPTNKRLKFLHTIEHIKELEDTHNYRYIFVENNGYQGAVVEQLEDSGIAAEGVASKADKRTRLSTVASKIESGQILFPKSGCEKLIEQIVHFGVEKHDDLMDAFVLASQQVLRHKDDFNILKLSFSSVRHSYPRLASEQGTPDEWDYYS